MGYVGKTKDYSITNLTVADIPVKYGDCEIKSMMFAGPVVSYGKTIIGVVTCNGKIVITRHERKESRDDSLLLLLKHQYLFFQYTFSPYTVVTNCPLSSSK